MKKRILPLIIGSVIIISCSGGDYFVSKDVYYQGLKLYKKGEYDDAKDLLKDAIYKAKGLTTKELLEARYRLANIYYKEKNYIDAIVEFEELLTLFPTSPYTPEVLYKLADSYIKISPDPDKDLTYPRKALDRAEELIVKYPNSPYVEKAKEIIKKVKKMEVEHYKNIADLYEKLGKYYGAVRYYQFILDEYGEVINKDEIKIKKAQALLRIKDQYRDELKEINEQQKIIRQKISKAKLEEEKKVLKNRLKLYEEQKEVLLNRIKEGKQEAKKILEELRQKPQYKNLATDLLREVN